MVQPEPGIIRLPVEVGVHVHPLLLTSFNLSSTYGHYWLQKNPPQKTKMATAAEPDSRRRNGSPQPMGDVLMGFHFIKKNFYKASSIITAYNTSMHLTKFISRHLYTHLNSGKT